MSVLSLPLAPIELIAAAWYAWQVRDCHVCTPGWPLKLLAVRLAGTSKSQHRWIDVGAMVTLVFLIWSFEVAFFFSCPLTAPGELMLSVLFWQRHMPLQHSLCSDAAILRSVFTV